MKISYSQFDDTNKQFQLTEGIYEIEKDRSDKWIWTSTNFSGIILNINSITFSLHSDIENTLLYENNSIRIYPKCLSVVKLKVDGKTNFNLKLLNPYVVENDDRVLGLKIVRILIDNDIIF